MKLAELFEVRRPKKKMKIKRPVKKDLGNDAIEYLGTDAIRRSFSGVE